MFALQLQFWWSRNGAGMDWGTAGNFVTMSSIEFCEFKSSSGNKILDHCHEDFYSFSSTSNASKLPHKPLQAKLFAEATQSRWIWITRQTSRSTNEPPCRWRHKTFWARVWARGPCRSEKKNNFNEWKSRVGSAALLFIWDFTKRSTQLHGAAPALALTHTADRGT